MCWKGVTRAGEEEAGRNPQGLLIKGRKLQRSEELDHDLVNLIPVHLSSSLWPGLPHREPSIRCAGVGKLLCVPAMTSAAATRPNFDEARGWYDLAGTLARMLLTERT